MPQTCPWFVALERQGVFSDDAQLQGAPIPFPALIGMSSHTGKAWLPMQKGLKNLTGSWPITISFSETPEK